VPNRSLELQTGPHKGERHRIVKDRTVIGRHPACEIVLDVSAVSRQHAVVTRQGSETVIEDLHSRNGTFVNGQQLIGKRVLFEGDEVLICDQKLVFWSNTPLSADRIEIGESTNIQDLVCLHADPGLPCTIGDRVTIGHGAIVHGATVESDCLIGIRATILNGAVIGRGTVIAAGALVTEGKLIPPNSLVMGIPAKVVREASEREAWMIERGWKHYVDIGAKYQQQLASESAHETT
jgi:carbonic anhydrase/acetyltransferase-like protein (isoleucine patch superfamily)